MPLPSVARSTLITALLLAAGMAVTRFHHFGSALHLPDASLAIFFLAGVYLRPSVFFPAFLGQAVLIDYLAITQAGVSDWCVSPAYGFLLPTYACTWLAGRWYATARRAHWRTLYPLMAALTLGITLAFVISNGSFYLLSGRFPTLHWLEYSARVARYFPPYATSTVLYVLGGIGLHSLITRITSSGAGTLTAEGRRS